MLRKVAVDLIAIRTIPPKTAIGAGGRRRLQRLAARRERSQAVAHRGLGKKFGGDATGFRWRAAAQLFGQQRSAGNRRSAAAAQKPGLGDPAGFETREEPEDVAANRI